MLSLWNLLAIYIHFTCVCGRKTSSTVWASSERQCCVNDSCWCLGSFRRHLKSSRGKAVEANNWDFWKETTEEDLYYSQHQQLRVLRPNPSGDEGCSWGTQNASADECCREGCSYPSVFPLHTQSHSSWCSRATSVSDLCNPLTPIFGLNWRTSWYFFVTLRGTHWHSLQLWRQQAQFPPQRLTRRQPGQNMVSVLFSSSRMDTEKFRGVQL